jgi:LacI family transcriptional regulator
VATDIPISPLSRQLLYEGVADGIRQLIHERALWESYLPPERELAHLFGVNRGTVRKGLEALEKEGYLCRRQGQGTRVVSREAIAARRKERRILVASFVGFPAKGEYYGEIIAGVTTGASDAAWNMAFHCGLRGPGRWERFIGELEGNHVDGVLLVSLTVRERVERILERWKGPAVVVDHHFSDLPLTGVIDDSRGAAREATEHLVSLGHRRIGFVDAAEPHINPWRYEGYVEALRAAGLEVDESLRIGCHSSIEESRAVGERLLALPDPVSAVLAHDDTHAWGVWQAAEARGLTVGREIAIVGYGDNPPPAGYAAELSTVRIDPRAMGEASVRELDRLIEGEAAPGKLVTLPAELVIRKSSRDARGPGSGGSA